MFINDYTIATTEDWKNDTTISDQIEDEVLNPFLLIGEEKHLYEILGDPLTLELKEAMTAITATTQLPAATQILINHCAKVSCYGAWYELIPINAIKTSNKGETVAGDATDQQLVLKRKAVLSNLNHYQKKLQKFLDDNSSTYPSYRSCCNTSFDDSTGFYLGNE